MILKVDDDQNWHTYCRRRLFYRSAKCRGDILRQNSLHLPKSVGRSKAPVFHPSGKELLKILGWSFAGDVFRRAENEGEHAVEQVELRLG